MEFNKQKDRVPFVLPTDPPHADRFSFSNHSPKISSKVRNSKYVNLAKQTVRRPIFDDYKGAPYYDVNHDLTKPKTSHTVMDFEKIPDRPENIIWQ